VIWWKCSCMHSQWGARSFVRGLEIRLKVSHNISTDEYTTSAKRKILRTRKTDMIKNYTTLNSDNFSIYPHISSHPPGHAPFLVFPGSDCFCLRYLLSDESWRIELRKKTMEMYFCVVFSGRILWLNSVTNEITSSIPHGDNKIFSRPWNVSSNFSAFLKSWK
jgi:hypothetical protein